jgi:hypothetical protein
MKIGTILFPRNRGHRRESPVEMPRSRRRARGRPIVRNAVPFCSSRSLAGRYLGDFTDRKLGTGRRRCSDKVTVAGLDRVRCDADGGGFVGGPALIAADPRSPGEYFAINVAADKLAALGIRT